MHPINTPNYQGQIPLQGKGMKEVISNNWNQKESR